MYGVDVNPMAVELCKVSLWMETLEPGKPLTFLDHHIQCGHSLLGTTPALLAQGIPDTAFMPIESDDKAVASAFRRRNKAEREGQMSFAAITEAAVPYGTLADGIASLETIDDSSITGVHGKEERYSRLAGSSEYRQARVVADAWCAAFVWRKTKDVPEPVTHDVFCRLLSEPEKVPAATRAEIARLAKQYRFFHWHLAFPDVFRIPTDDADPENDLAGWNGGFDVVVGNPPWERIKIQEKEWFATRRPDIAAAPNAAARRRLISALATEDPELHAAFLDAGRQAEGESHLVHNSGRYPLCGRGDINTYAIFAETNRLLMSPTGRVGCILPSGIATDDTTKYFFQDIVTSRSLTSLYHFENEDRIFPEVHHAFRFCLLTMSGLGRPVQAATFVAYARNVTAITDTERRFSLQAEDFALLNPNTLTFPPFRSRRDAEISKAIYRRVPVLIKEGPLEENPWGVEFLRMLDMTNDSQLLHTRAQLEASGWDLKGNIFEQSGKRFLPLYEAKMIHHFDHRFGTYENQTEEQARQGKLPELTDTQHAGAHFLSLPRYWVDEAEVNARLKDRWDCGWLLGWRDITGSEKIRTVIASIVPWVGVGNSAPLILLQDEVVHLGGLLAANLSSFVLDFAARFKVGGTHLNFFIINQLPVLPPLTYTKPCSWAGPPTPYSLLSWLLPRVLELTYTAWDLEPFATDCVYSGPPFRWDAERRFLLRCELDAAYFHLYGIARDAVDYIMETFPIVKRNDMRQYGDFRTKLTILDIYDRMQQAMDSGKPYQTLLDLPPADPRVAHPPRTEG
jgi:hypothetical protein